MGGGQTQQILDRRGVEPFRPMAVITQGLFQQFEAGLLREFIALDDGVAEDLLFDAARRCLLDKG